MGLAPDEQLNVYTGSGKHVLKGAKDFMHFNYGGGNNDDGFKFDEYKCEVCGRSGADLDEKWKFFFIRPCWPCSAPGMPVERPCPDPWPCFECTIAGKAPLECKTCGEESVSVTLYEFDNVDDDADGSGSDDKEDGESDDDDNSSGCHDEEPPDHNDKQEDTDQDTEAAKTGTDDALGTVVDFAAQDLTTPDGEQRPPPPLNSGLKQIHDLEASTVKIKQERDAAAEDRDDEADERRIAHSFIERQKDKMTEERKTIEDQRKTIEDQSQRIRQLEDRVRELEAEQRGAPSTLRASPRKKTRSRR